MNKQIAEIKAAIKEATLRCDSDWIALSGGLDSSIIAKIKNEKNINGIAVITKDFIGTDLSYSQIIANYLKIPLELKYVNINDMLNAIEKTIKILKNFNDIEIRNSIVSYLYLNTLKEKNVTKVITGDGADELFAGYSFLIKKDHTELKNELERMKKVMHFTSQKIASSLGMSIQMPFVDKSVIKLVETMPIDLLVNQKNGTKFGKWILRKSFENDLPANVIWRKKTPMQDGSGTVNLTKLFDTIITDDIFQNKIKKIKKEDNVIIRTKESLHYYEIYKQNFKIPDLQNDKDVCADCNSEISINSNFCKICGKFPLT